MKINQKGFSVIEALLILVIVGIIGGVGYFVYHSQKKTNETLDNTSKSTSAVIKSTSKSQSEEPKQSPTSSTPSKNSGEISDDLVVCSVNPAAQSGAGLKVAFYGYIKGDNYSVAWLEYGTDSGNLNLRTANITLTGPDECSELLTSLAAGSLSPGKYFYRVAATTKSGATMYSKTDNFTKELE